MAKQLDYYSFKENDRFEESSNANHEEDEEILDDDYDNHSFEEDFGVPIKPDTGMNISHENQNFSRIDLKISNLFQIQKKILDTDYRRLSLL